VKEKVVYRQFVALLVMLHLKEINIARQYTFEQKINEQKVILVGLFMIFACDLQIRQFRYCETRARRSFEKAEEKILNSR
jgi:hypothetical protein